MWESEAKAIDMISKARAISVIVKEAYIKCREAKSQETRPCSGEYLCSDNKKAA